MKPVLLSPSKWAETYALADKRRECRNWPFGVLTPQQIKEREAQERAMRAQRLAKYPEGLF